MSLEPESKARRKPRKYRGQDRGASKDHKVGAQSGTGQGPLYDRWHELQKQVTQPGDRWRKDTGGLGRWGRVRAGPGELGPHIRPESGLGPRPKGGGAWREEDHDPERRREELGGPAGGLGE